MLVYCSRSSSARAPIRICEILGGEQCCAANTQVVHVLGNAPSFQSLRILIFQPSMSDDMFRLCFGQSRDNDYAGLEIQRQTIGMES